MINNIDDTNLYQLRFLRWFCPPALYEGIEGDVLEKFDDDLRAHGQRRARRRLWLHVFAFFRPGIILRNKISTPFIHTIMLGNYMKVAARNMAKRKLYSFINAFGLSVAIAFCTLIYLFVQDEKSFDQFHSNKDRIYRMHVEGFSRELFEKGEKEPYDGHPYMPASLGPRMLEEIPEIEYFTRYNGWGEAVMTYKEKIFKQKFSYVDSGFFKMFDFKIVEGSAKGIFVNPTDAVLTRETARKYFGDEDPIGKVFTLEVEGLRTMTVVAIIEAPPANSSIGYEMLVPLELQPWLKRNQDNWGSFSYPTFVQLKEHASPEMFKTHLDTLISKHAGARFEGWRKRENIPAEFKVIEFLFAPLTAIHNMKDISWEKVSDPQYSIILAGIAILIMVIACINYISLALTTSASRRIEVGIRKVVGAQKKQLVYQFGVESILLSFISMIIGFGLVVAFLPAFNDFTNKGIELTWPVMVKCGTVMLGITVVVGVLAGGYPSFFLSRFLPATVLKGRFTSRLQAGFTKPLVVIQFFLSASMIISSVIMLKQMRFVTTKDLGYDKNQVVRMDMQMGWSPEADVAVDRLRNKLRNDPDVVGVAGVSASFNHGWSRYGYKIKDENKSAYVYRVDPEYLSLLGIEITAGRNFDESRASDSTAIIVNEALVKDMGWTDPLDEYLNWREDSVGPGSRVIGVAKNYNFLSLEREIEPLFLSMDAKNTGYLSTALIRFTPGGLPDKIEKLRNVWLELYPDKPFDYSFVDDDVARQYEAYQRWTMIMGLSTIFAIIIACLGLFGLAGINAVNRTKEIGIRKVMGAEVGSIFVLLNRQYVWLAVIAFALATPCAWYLMSLWLDSFKYSITMTWDVFVLSMLAGLIIALLTVSYHSVRAALVNPAETLKYE